MNWKKIASPINDDVIKGLRTSDMILLSGVMYTARDMAHERISKMEMNPSELPFDADGQLLYYMGPSPAPEGRVIGAAGPTTSNRMDAYTEVILSLGFKGLIGKGSRSADVRRHLADYRAIYFSTFGGAGAYLSRRVVDAVSVAFEDLGTEAIYRLEVKDFPMIVVNDIYGNDLYEEGKRTYAKD